MNIAVVGSGYVGLTAGICFAESGNEVICVDIDREKVDRLNLGELPIYEPGLQELLTGNLSSGRLRFSCDLPEAVRESLIIFIAVGTPSREDGLPDVSMVENVARSIIGAMDDYRILVIKSTVPVGTTVRLAEQLSRLTDTPFDLASNPEFLKEGYAIDDFSRPDRVIIGTTSPKAAQMLEELYAPFVRNGKPIIVMDPTSSEMAKYAANALLSTKISFINELANLCEKLGADIDDVRRGICSDSRIGYQFLYPGLGFGGSCFPKDIEALVRICDQVGYPGWLLKSVKEVNDYQKHTLQRKVRAHFGDDLTGLKFAVWGLSFKPRTDDVRESAAMDLIADLLAGGAKVSVHDPQALENAKKVLDDQVIYCHQMYDAVDGADGLCVVTEWNEYRNPSYDKMLAALRRPVIFDGRNVYDPVKMRAMGFVYFGIGKK